ncbi:uncharacterized protein OCT59_015384 [Rhizophagus irregularis]|uniref:uncharacterized protein n=1 Tax=Rhizophagus irregularis TaxID=588596 RepID=UPI003326D674|nr:hypothetical protein OCT59_015384 [Rhizophagus irregularis]
MEDKVYHEVHSFLLLRKRQSSSVIHILPQRYSSYSVALEEVYKMVCMKSNSQETKIEKPIIYKYIERDHQIRSFQIFPR